MKVFLFNRQEVGLALSQEWSFAVSQTALEPAQPGIHDEHRRYVVNRRGVLEERTLWSSDLSPLPLACIPSYR